MARQEVMGAKINWNFSNLRNKMALWNFKRIMQTILARSHMWFKHGEKILAYCGQLVYPILLSINQKNMLFRLRWHKTIVPLTVINCQTPLLFPAPEHLLPIHRQHVLFLRLRHGRGDDGAAVERGRSDPKRGRLLFPHHWRPLHDHHSCCGICELRKIVPRPCYTAIYVDSVK